MPDRNRVAVLGDGLIAGTVRVLLGQIASVDTIDSVGDELAGSDAVVVARDGWETLGHEVIQSAAFRAGIPCLPVRVELGTAVIGPTAVPGVPGCLSCAAIRYEAAHRDESWLAQVPTRFPDRAFAPAPLLTRAAAGVIARIVTTEVALTLADGRVNQRTDSSVVRLRLDTLAVRTHRFLPVASCRYCGATLADSAELAEIELRPRPKPARDRHRLHDLVKDVLYDTYLDAEMGLARELTKVVPASFPAASASVVLADRSGDSGYGRALDFQSAQLTAVAEGVERLAGVRPGAKRTTVCGSHRELAKDAVNPVDLGLYPDDWYDQPGFPYRRYTPDVTTTWVWGYSFARAAPVLVPETHAYYGLVDHSAAPFACETSNGCSLGSCQEEAILHGLLELVERDAFLMTWYTRRPARQLDLSTATDRTIPLMVERIQHDSGHQVLAYDITMEHGVPAVWTMLVHPSNDRTEVKVRCSAGVGFDPERALVGALLEVVGGLDWQRATFVSEMDRIERMVDDSHQVRTMPDHALLYSHSKAFERLGFLTEGLPPVPIAESFAGVLQATSTDLTDDLNAVVARFLDRGLDVIVVDQTAAEQRAGGFVCVRVLVPGLVPMTFGHRNRRLAGLPRLFSAPVELGYATHPLRPEELNPYPHPFP